MSDPVLHLEQIVKRYHDGTRELEVLRDLNLSVQAGESVAIVGRSGTGKTTLLNLLGLLDRPDAGRICIGGADASKLGERARAKLRRQMIGFVFQQYHLLPELNALENVCIAASIAGQGSAARAEELLNAAGLGERLRHRPGQLSGGEQQRVAIARALVHGPDLVLADEPTGSLDADTGDRVLELLLERVPETGGALLLVTHARQLADRMDRTLVLEAGRIRDCAGE